LNFESRQLEELPKTNVGKTLIITIKMIDHK